jgi:polysaccharide export outer membrane protein
MVSDTWRATFGSMTRSALPGLRVLRTYAVAAVGLVLASTAARAEYTLQPGDTLDFALLGMTDLKQRSTIGPDGEISLPLVGQVKAAGQTLTHLKATVKGLLASRLYRQITTDGRENMIVIGGEELSLDVATYRPIYVSGDVLKAGEQPFRPGMTVRQAVSVAGGFDILKLKLGNPLIDPIDFKAQLGADMAEYAREQARTARIQAELAGAAELNLDSITAPGLPAATMERIKDTERKTFAARTADLKKEMDWLRDTIGTAEKRMATLGEQQDKELEGNREDLAELERVKELVSRGSAPITRIIDARRTSLFSATRVLQTTMSAQTLERDRDELKRKIVKVADEYRMALLNQAQESTLKMATLRARMDGVREKMGIASAPRLVQTEAAKPTLVIFRKDGQGIERIEAALDSELTPGDVVEVTVPVSDILNLSAQTAEAVPTR